LPVTIGDKNVHFRISGLSLPSLSENDQFLDVKARISFNLLNIDGLFSGFPFYGALIEVFFYRGWREPDDLGAYTKLKEGVCRTYSKTLESVHVSAEVLAQPLRFLIKLPTAAELFPQTFLDPFLGVSMPLQNGENVVPVIAGYRFIAQKPIYSTGKVQAAVKPEYQFRPHDYFIIPVAAGDGDAAFVHFIGAIGAGLWLDVRGERATGGILTIEKLAFLSAESFTPYDFLSYLLNTYSNFPFSSALWDKTDNAWLKNKVYPLSFTLDKNMSFNEIISAFKIFQLMIVQKPNGLLALRSKLYPPPTVRSVYLKKAVTESLEEPEVYSSLAVTFQSIAAENFKTSTTAFIRDASQAAAVSATYHIVSELAIEIPVPVDEFAPALNALERIYQHPRRTFSGECLENYGDMLLTIQIYDLVRVNLDDPVDAGFGGENTFICTAIDYRNKTITLGEIL
jgi:hypothetical protein